MPCSLHSTATGASLALPQDAHDGAVFADLHVKTTFSLVRGDFLLLIDLVI
jgi:hypothetical protein